MDSRWGRSNGGEKFVKKINYPEIIFFSLTLIFFEN
jgi:hypothetical protein